MTTFTHVRLGSVEVPDHDPTVRKVTKTTHGKDRHTYLLKATHADGTRMVRFMSREAFEAHPAPELVS